MVTELVLPAIATHPSFDSGYARSPLVERYDTLAWDWMVEGERAGLDVGDLSVAEQWQGQALVASLLLRAGHPAVIELVPHNGTRYVLVCTLLEPDASGPVGGGRLVVSLPLRNASLALDHVGYHVPDYIEEKLRGLGSATHTYTDCVVLATFLTMLSVRLDTA